MKYHRSALFVLWGSEDRELLWNLAARLRGHFEDTRIEIETLSGHLAGTQMAWYCKRDYAA